VPRKYWISLVELIGSKAIGPQVGCEVGVWKGDLSRYLLRELPDLHLLMVDIYREFTTEEALLTLGMDAINQEDTYAVMQRALQQTQEYRERRTMLVADSLVASTYIKDGILDFVFIDACHDYESVRFDIQTWFPKVKNNGIVCGHDYGGYQDVRGVFGVKEAVDDFARANGYQVTLLPGKIWYIIK